MARAAYIIKKDGRYWFQKRFATVAYSQGVSTHCRIALRTADYRVAVSRMLKVAQLVQEFESQPDIASRASMLMADMQRLNTKMDREGLVERRTLETLASRLITEARFRAHPLTVDPPGFWAAWMGFVNTNVLLESVQETVQRPQARVASVSVSSPGIAAQEQPAPPRKPVGESSDILHELHAGSTLSEVRRAFLDQRRVADGDGRAEEDTGIVVQFLIDFLGDRAINEIVAADLLRVENALPRIPHPHGVPKEAQVSLHQRWLYAEQHGWDGLKAISKTRLRNGWHRGLQAFFAWARGKGIYSGPEYAFKLTARENREEQERDAWKPEEILKLFSLPLFTGCRSAAHHWEPGNVFLQNHLYWAYLLIFFTGMRPSEIGKLRNEQVVEIEGDWYFDFRGASASVAATSVKSKAGRRLVPIPRLLLDLGLLERKSALLAQGEGRLFPAWKVYVNKKSGREMWGHEFSKSWQYIKVKFGFTREALTLYGGRHTRATWYDEAGIPQRVRIRLLGHAPSSVSERYGAIHITPEETKLVLSKTNAVEEAIAEILIEAKLKADYAQLAPAAL
ncbi:tyrosine-type recombinase/integrase [Devosia sp. D6-9]|nr:tyrosine-type recombinase/integrase [Devosia sp. D6-9]